MNLNSGTIKDKGTNTNATITNSAAIGTVVRITCLASGASNAAEIWLAEVFGASAVTNA